MLPRKGEKFHQTFARNGGMPLQITRCAKIQLNFVLSAKIFPHLFTFFGKS
jgi:hypothetical protein